MRATVRCLTGIAVCALPAAMLCFFLRDGATLRLVAPILCLQVVIVAALHLGRWPAVMGAVIAGFTFALLLYPPYGSLWIHDPAERVVLTLFQLIAVIVAWISPRRTSPNDRIY